jgi:predicted transcriptional regulator
MGVTEILHEIEALPSVEQLLLFEKLKKLAKQDVPESFLQGMAEAERGELIDMDEALRELDRP